MRARLLPDAPLVDLAADDKLHVCDDYITDLFAEHVTLNPGANWYLNPPWKRSAKFIRRALELRATSGHKGALIVMIPASTNGSWWKEIVVESPARPDVVFFTHPRIVFAGHDNGATRDTALLLWGQRDFRPWAAIQQHLYWNWITGQIVSQ